MLTDASRRSAGKEPVECEQNVDVAISSHPID